MVAMSQLRCSPLTGYYHSHNQSRDLSGVSARFCDNRVCFNPLKTGDVVFKQLDHLKYQVPCVGVGGGDGGLAASVSCSDSSESLNSSPSSPCLTRPPLPPQTRRYRNESSLSPPDQKLNAWRSFSLSDLQGAAAAAPSLMGIKE